MPALEFNGTDLYLRIHLAQKEGLINVVSEVCCSGISPYLKLYSKCKLAPFSTLASPSFYRVLLGETQELVRSRSSLSLTAGMYANSGVRTNYTNSLLPA